MKVDRLILRRKLASFLFCRQTIQNRRILSNALAQAVITRMHDAHLWHETRPRRIQHPLGAMGEVCNARDTRLNARLRSRFFPPIFLTTLRPGSASTVKRTISSVKHPKYLHCLEVGDQISRLESFYLTLVPILL